MIGREDLIAALRAGVVVVTFTKVSGEGRVMRCTLHPSLLPVRPEGSEDGRTREPGSAISVWDVDVEGWRSFRYDSVTDVRIGDCQDCGV